MYTTARNVLSENSLKLLVDFAKQQDTKPLHADINSKCFCFNACIFFDKSLDPNIIHTHNLLEKEHKLNGKIVLVIFELLKIVA